ncbi:MAG: GNAT family N-acetyltransferase [Nitrospiraceae bacterium]|nr:MAG: GNAT family N-acetyltransferase [Nitrospiraceae bacterium]
MIRAQAYDVNIESVDDLFPYWSGGQTALDWNCLFTLPPWLRAWQETAAGARKPFLCVFRQEGRVAGIAPLMVQGEGASMMGDAHLCDYGDFITVPGTEREFAAALVAHLRNKGIASLDLGRVRADSPAMRGLKDCCVAGGWEVICESADQAYELSLPGKWTEYLGRLTRKERHEVRRKMRRIKEAGVLRFRCIEGGADLREGMDVFIALFRMARADKARFMTAETESFFRMVAGEMAEARLLKLFVLDVGGRPAAAALCFDYRSTVYLYNSGYDRQYSRLSAGLMCKTMSIKHSIGMGLSSFNFLLGDEQYKGRLGGRPVQLERLRVILA